MAEPLECPHCSKLLTDSQVSTLYGRMTNARRKTKSGGKNGGRRKPDPDVPAGYVRAFPSTPEQRAALDAEIAACPHYTIPNPTTSPDSAEDAKGYPERILVPLEDL